ncbi:MAG: tRNA (adenosine(37)-N6)-threonylcarbamoyltransferase complex dimerization subunit type 1 TsaB, partial [Bacteroidales bacterium]|nr:tRNA (adenosine(37)-N6)-threonylcarbamoyltransferase complex dimerization subunit type 1 TsaB [Bacteroidales bacterium]
MLLEENEDCLFCPMIDARRMEVYCAVYDKKFTEILPVTNLIIDEHSFGDYLLQKPIVFCGNAVEKVQSVIAYQRNAHFSNVVCSAAYMAKLAYDKYVQQQFVDVAYFEPFYLKAFQSAVSKVKGLV